MKRENDSSFSSLNVCSGWVRAVDGWPHSDGLGPSSPLPSFPPSVHESVVGSGLLSPVRLLLLAQEQALLLGPLPGPASLSTFLK